MTTELTTLAVPTFDRPMALRLGNYEASGGAEVSAKAIVWLDDEGYLNLTVSTLVGNFVVQESTSRWRLLP